MKGKIVKLIMVSIAIGAFVAFGSTAALSRDSIFDDEEIYSPEDEVEKDVDPDWGGVDFISWTAHSLDFTGYNAIHDAYIRQSGGRRYCTNSCTLEVSIHLPQGARIIGWELDAYDAGSGSVSLGIGRCAYNSSNCSLLAARTTTSGTPGYTQIFRTLSHTVNNWHGYYIFETDLTGGNSYGIVGGLIMYRLQISPAPAIPTFNDVSPGAWYYQAVEALADSGITVGCGGGSYCPNEYVTRAQMAAFLARALGLHYPH